MIFCGLHFSLKLPSGSGKGKSTNLSWSLLSLFLSGNANMAIVLTRAQNYNASLKLCNT